MGFPGAAGGKKQTNKQTHTPANAGDIRDANSVPGLGRSPGRGHGNPLQYSCLENPKDREAWRVTVNGVSESDMTEAT